MSINGRNKFFKGDTLSNTDFNEIATHRWEFRATGLLIAIDSGGPLSFSYNGKDLDGVLFITDKWIAFDNHDESKIWLKAQSPCVYRIWAWEKRV